MSLKPKDPLELLIRIFVNGGQVKWEGWTWAMAEDGDICWLSDREFGHGSEMTVKALKQMAHDIGPEQLWMQCCALTLEAPNRIRS